MVQRLEVDTDMLRTLARDIMVIRSELKAADTNVSDVVAAVGHSGLGGRLESFTSSWRVNRERLFESLAGLDDTALSLADTFDEADRELASALHGGDGP